MWIKTRSLESTALPLLLVNRLINRHVQDIMATERSIRDYAIDIMFVKMAGLWPTWTRVPVLTRHVDTVHATFRIFNPAPDLDSKFDASGLLGAGCGGYHTVTGPGLVHVEPGVRGMGEAFSLRRPEGWKGPASLDPRIEPAEKLALFLHDWVSRFLTLFTETDNATILYEDIMDSIQFRVNGKVQLHVDIEEAFAMAEPPWSLTREDSQRERFLQWTEWVTEKRRLNRLGHDLPREKPHRSIMFVNEDPVYENDMLTRK